MISVAIKACRDRRVFWEEIFSYLLEPLTIQQVMLYCFTLVATVSTVGAYLGGQPAPMCIQKCMSSSQPEDVALVSPFQLIYGIFWVRGSLEFVQSSPCVILCPLGSPGLFTMFSGKGLGCVVGCSFIHLGHV